MKNIPIPGVIYGQTRAEWDKRELWKPLVEQGPLKLHDWPKIGQCIYRGTGFVVLTDDLERVLNFSGRGIAA